jgi:hypothetical protein
MTRNINDIEVAIQEKKLERSAAKSSRAFQMWVILAILISMGATIAATGHFGFGLLGAIPLLFLRSKMTTADEHVKRLPLIEKELEALQTEARLARNAMTERANQGFPAPMTDGAVAKNSAPEQVKQNFPTQPPISDEMACPMCAETIKKAAKICKHCKHVLS